MRSGQDLVAMTQEMLRDIFEEPRLDFTASYCPGASLSDLDPQAIEILRSKWIRKSGNKTLARLSVQQLLTDAELIADDHISYAALVLLGTSRALGQHLNQAEVVFEYRSSGASGPAQERVNFRQGYLLFADEIWDLVNLRNDLQHFNDALFVWDIPTFNEKVVREAINNAVCHRDYRLMGSVFVRQYPRSMTIESPCGFPPGITLENILWRHVPRNRRLVEVFEKCGLVERSGQGVNVMFEQAIKESRGRPDFAGTDDYQVALTLPGAVQDPQFIRFLEKLGSQQTGNFNTEDLLVLDLIHREQAIPESLQSRIPILVEAGVIERGGRRKLMLSRGLYSHLGKRGVYTRKRGLDRETNKALLLKHITENAEEGSQLYELAQVLPSLSRPQLQRLLREMRVAGLISSVGLTRAARWFPVESREM